MGEIFLVEKEIGAFKNFLESKQIDQLHRKYGLTLLYSLDGEDMIEYERELGIKPRTAVDFYNHGVYCAVNKNNIGQASKHFQKAIEMDSTLSSAYYNLAMIHLACLPACGQGRQTGQAEKDSKLAKKELAEFIRLEENKELKNGEVHYLEEAKKVLKELV